MDILLIEDNAEDVEITLRAFQKHHIANKIHVVRDGKRLWSACFPRDGMRKEVPARISGSSFSISSFRRSTGWKSYRSARAIHEPGTFRSSS
jgi:hypothetical protein